MPSSGRRDRLAVFLATGCALGHLRPGPGTWASAVAILIALAAALLGAPAWTILAAGGGAYLLGYAVCPAATRRFDCEDPSSVVIDEIAACWIAFGVVALAPDVAGQRRLMLAAALVFATFRVFDIVKPWPVGWAEGLPAPTGIMADDLIAGILAALVTAALIG